MFLNLIQKMTKIQYEYNKAGYTAQDAPGTRLKITRDGRTYGRTDLRTDTTSYRDATAHLKILLKKGFFLKQPPLFEFDWRKYNKRIIIKLRIIWVGMNYTREVMAFDFCMIILPYSTTKSRYCFGTSCALLESALPLAVWVRFRVFG